jgi:hypothetical protein
MQASPLVPFIIMSLLWAYYLMSQQLGLITALNKLEGFGMGKRNKSKRFVQKSANSVSKHDERIPYHMTYSEAEAQKLKNVNESSLGGI